MEQWSKQVKYWARNLFLLLMFSLGIFGKQSPPEKPPVIFPTTVVGFAASGSGPVFGFDRSDSLVAGFDRGRWS